MWSHGVGHDWSDLAAVAAPPSKKNQIAKTSLESGWEISIPVAAIYRKNVYFLTKNFEACTETGNCDLYMTETVRVSK